MLTRVRILVLALAVVAALALSACGSGGGGGVSDDDPASLAPADSPVYIQALLRPRGELKQSAESLASTVSGIDDPTGRVIAMIDQSLADNHPLSGKKQTFEKDFEPWIGDRAGLFVEGLSGNPPAAGIVQTTDPEATQKTIDEGREAGDRKRSYGDVDYLLSADGTAVGVVGDFLVLGNERAFKDAVDVSNGDTDPLGGQSAFTDTLDQAPSGSLVDAYLSLEKTTEAIRANSPSSATGFEGAFGDTAGKSVLASLVPTADSAEFDLATNANQSFQLTDLTKLIASFPSSSFVAVGIPNLGDRINETLDQLDKAGLPGVNRKAIDQQLALTGLSLDDITGALGDLGIFVEGSDRASLQGAGVITSPDPSSAKSLIDTLSKLAVSSGQSGISKAKVGSGFEVTDPQNLGNQPLTVTAAGPGIVVGYGRQATAQAVTGQATRLEDDPYFIKAGAALGGAGISAYASLSKIFRLADSLGSLRDPDYVKARPYLDKLTYAVLGSAKQGDFDTSKLIVGVKP